MSDLQVASVPELMKRLESLYAELGGAGSKQARLVRWAFHRLNHVHEQIEVSADNNMRLLDDADQLRAENARLTMLSGLLAASKIELVDWNSELQAENARLADQLQAVSDQLADAVQRVQEAERELVEAREILKNEFCAPSEHKITCNIYKCDCGLYDAQCRYYDYLQRIAD